MGNFYTNITLMGPPQDQVIEFLQARGRVAFISPTVNEFTVVYDRECDSQDERILHSLTASLSGEFECPALFVLNHDDDILQYGLYQSGLRLDEYNSCPDYFGGPDDDIDYDSDEYREDDEMQDEAPPQGPSGGDAGQLCKAFRRDDNISQVHEILHGKRHVFALEQHEALVKALGLPGVSVGSGFEYINRGESPNGLEVGDLKRTE